MYCKRCGTKLKTKKTNKYGRKAAEGLGFYETKTYYCPKCYYK